MKRKVYLSVLLALTLGLALSCGPGNGSAPYKGSFYLTIASGSASWDLTSDGAMWSIPVSATVTDSLSDLQGLPVPNIQVDVWIVVSARTIQDYSRGNPFLLTGGGETQDVRVDPVLRLHTNFNGVVNAIVDIPQYFDGVLQVVMSTTNSTAIVDIDVTYDSGTSCTDGDDNDDNGFADHNDPNCPNGYNVEPTTGTGAFTAVQNPAGGVVVGVGVAGSVNIQVTGGVAPYTFTSSNLGIATVSGAGLVTAVSAGTVGITVTDNLGVTTLVNVTISAMASVTIAPPAATVAALATQQLTATAVDAGAANLVGLVQGDFTWLSSNNPAATVDGVGLVTGVATGVANVTASAGGFTSPNSVITVP